jgi:hypothetical protein
MKIRSAPSPRRMRRTVSRLGVRTLRSIRLKWLRSTFANWAICNSVLPCRRRIERRAEPNGKDNRFELRVESRPFMRGISNVEEPMGAWHLRQRSELSTNCRSPQEMQVKIIAISSYVIGTWILRNSTVHLDFAAFPRIPQKSGPFAWNWAEIYCRPIAARFEEWLTKSPAPVLLLCSCVGLRHRNAR